MIQEFLCAIRCDSGMKITDKPIHICQFCIQVDVDLLLGLDILDEFSQILLNILTLPGFEEVSGLASQGVVLFDEMGVITLFCQILRSDHA